MQNLKIVSPKRNRSIQTGWEAFFPYYAGYPELFVDAILQSAGLAQDSVILDPWNGSGTTTSTAAKLGYKSIGYDINPVMVVIARARLLPLSEADALEPILNQILDGTEHTKRAYPNDPLSNWFYAETVGHIRDIERSIRLRLVGSLTIGLNGVNLGYLSSIAAAFYVALFAVCRELAVSFRSTNPTWIRVSKNNADKVQIKRAKIHQQFRHQILSMTKELAKSGNGFANGLLTTDIRTADSRECCVDKGTVDLVITSPPYCTRIDYTAATRVELAVLNSLFSTDCLELSREMIGSTRVPLNDIEVEEEWGETCRLFLENVKSHPSKASNGYYLKTHLDYFEKMAASMRAIREALTDTGQAIMVVQDSFYKEVHNDLPSILSEMALSANLSLKRREKFSVRRSMSGINPKSKNYNRRSGATESVLCFEAV